MFKFFKRLFHKPITFPESPYDGRGAELVTVVVTPEVATRVWLAAAEAMHPLANVFGPLTQYGGKVRMTFNERATARRLVQDGTILR